MSIPAGLLDERVVIRSRLPDHGEDKYGNYRGGFVGFSRQAAVSEPTAELTAGVTNYGISADARFTLRYDSETQAISEQDFLKIMRSEEVYRVIGRRSRHREGLIDLTAKRETDLEFPELAKPPLTIAPWGNARGQIRLAITVPTVEGEATVCVIYVQTRPGTGDESAEWSDLADPSIHTDTFFMDGLPYTDYETFSIEPGQYDVRVASTDKVGGLLGPWSNIVHQNAT